MNGRFGTAAVALLAVGVSAGAQLPGAPQIKIDTANRVLTVSAQGIVSVDPEVAILHIGFETRVQDAQSAYADGSRTSNSIVTALKQAGLEEAALRSESQTLEPVDAKNHRFKLVQSWTVKAPPDRAATLLDVAVTAGATESGEIEWTVKDTHALEDQALERAAVRTRQDASVLAKASGAKLGSLIYVTSVAAGSETEWADSKTDRLYGNIAGKMRAQVAPLAIEPHKVSRSATVYAVFAIE